MKKLVELIKPIFEIYGEKINPAPEFEIEKFINIARQKCVPQNAINQISDFYRITNGIPRGISKIEDGIIFEWWDDDKELWLGQVDMDTIRWKDNLFHLGDPSNLNYGEEYTSDNIYGILKIGIKDWYSDDNIYNE